MGWVWEHGVLPGEDQNCKRILVQKQQKSNLSGKHLLFPSRLTVEPFQLFLRVELELFFNGTTTFRWLQPRGPGPELYYYNFFNDTTTFRWLQPGGPGPGALVQLFLMKRRPLDDYSPVVLDLEFSYNYFFDETTTFRWLQPRGSGPGGWSGRLRLRQRLICRRKSLMYCTIVPSQCNQGSNIYLTVFRNRVLLNFRLIQVSI